ncbi:MAG: family 16 glycosylhydrolase [Chitinophagaceae bacterium]
MKHILLALIVLTSIACGKGGGGDDTPGPRPSLSIENFNLFEGTGTTTAFNVIVRLSVTSSETVTVNYSTADVTAKATEDYTAPSNQTLTFAPNETRKTITISILADDLRESDEEFKVILSNPVNATISAGTAVVAIRNDDTRIGFTNTGYDAPTSYAGYTRVWTDDFNGPVLDPTSWAHQNGDGCPNICGWGNNELEWYTNRAENLFFQDGCMIIAALNDGYGGKAYTSSKILSQNLKSFKFGRIDFRARLPIGKGIWPAFWMLPNSPSFGWPKSGEIDIMENIGHLPKVTYGTLHYGPGPGSTQSNGSRTNSTNLSDEFHVYSIEWKEDQIKWFLDGQEFYTANKSDMNLGGTEYPFNSEFFFIINLAVGGNWPGSPDASTVFPQFYIIDYLRVYQ